MMAISTKQALTADEFWELPEVPGKRLELVDGEVIEVPGSNWLHTELVLHIFGLIRHYAQNKGLGRVYADGATYLISRNPGTIRIPDVSFIPQERLPVGGPPPSYIEVVPALVIEVVSPSNTAADLRRRIEDYLEAGVSQAWVVWPDSKVVSVYTDSMIPAEFSADDTLDGGDVLTGFSVKVADLFDIEW